MSPKPQVQSPEQLAQAAQQAGSTNIPNDCVILLIWREGFGPQPYQVVATRESWDKNKELLKSDGQFVMSRVYEFDSPLDQNGRRVVYQFSQVTSWMANYYVGIVPAKISHKVH